MNEYSSGKFNFKLSQDDQGQYWVSAHLDKGDLEPEIQGHPSEGVAVFEESDPIDFRKVQSPEGWTEGLDSWAQELYVETIPQDKYTETQIRALGHFVVFSNNTQVDPRMISLEGPLAEGWIKENQLRCDFDYLPNGKGFIGWGVHACYRPDMIMSEIPDGMWGEVLAGYKERDAKEVVKKLADTPWDDFQREDEWDVCKSCGGPMPFDEGPICEYCQEVIRDKEESDFESGRSKGLEDMDESTHKDDPVFDKDTPKSDSKGKGSGHGHSRDSHSTPDKRLKWDAQGADTFVLSPVEHECRPRINYFYDARIEGGEWIVRGGDSPEEMKEIASGSEGSEEDAKKAVEVVIKEDAHHKDDVKDVSDKLHGGKDPHPGETEDFPEGPPVDDLPSEAADYAMDTSADPDYKFEPIQPQPETLPDDVKDRMTNQEFSDYHTRDRHIMPKDMQGRDMSEYPNKESEGLEGPYMDKNKRVVYWDRRENLYYDPVSDLYIGQNNIKIGPDDEQESESKYATKQADWGSHWGERACPKCGDMTKGQPVEDFHIAENSPSYSAPALGRAGTDNEFTCEHCGSEWGTDKGKFGAIPEPDPDPYAWLAQADELSMAQYGKPYRELPDDGEEQDHIRGLATPDDELDVVKMLQNPHPKQWTQEEKDDYYRKVRESGGVSESDPSFEGYSAEDKNLGPGKRDIDHQYGKGTPPWELPEQDEEEEGTE